MLTRRCMQRHHFLRKGFQSGKSSFRNQTPEVTNPFFENICVYPGCDNKMSTWTKYSFHRLPIRNWDVLKLWLVALKMDPNITVPRLKRLDDRVQCPLLIRGLPLREKKEGQRFQHQHIKKNAVPLAAEEHTQKAGVRCSYFCLNF